MTSHQEPSMSASPQATQTSLKVATSATDSAPSSVSESDPTVPVAVLQAPKSQKVARAFERVYGVLSVLGLAFVVPLIRIARGEVVQPQLRELWRLFCVPV